MKCPNCNGSGRVTNPGAGNCDPPWMDCPKCGGTGKVPDSDEEVDWMEWLEGFTLVYLIVGLVAAAWSYHVLYPVPLAWYLQIGVSLSIGLFWLPLALYVAYRAVRYMDYYD